MIKEYRFINAFRALAALWVLLAHCMIWGNCFLIPLPWPKIAVDLFMMISGFLMTANATRRRQSFLIPAEIYRFWLKRFFRIAPAYYLLLITVVFASKYFLGGYHALQVLLHPGKLWHWSLDPSRVQYTLENLLLHLSFLFGLHPKWSISTFLPDWSLSLEMQFYFLFPFLFIIISRWITSGIIISFVFWSIGIVISSHIRYDVPSLLAFKLQYFVSGILIFYTLNRTRRIWLIICAVALVSFEKTYGNQIIIPPMLVVAMLILGLLEKKGIPLRFLNWRVIRFASDVSYGVYLFHGVFISISGLILSRNPELLLLSPLYRILLIFSFVIPCSYLTGYFIFRWVELPGIQFGNSIIQRRITIPVTIHNA